jgi:hypothetical protein
MKKYFGQYFLDFILCVLIGSGVSVNVFAGYEMNDPWSANLPVVVFTVLCITAVLFVSRFNRYGMRIAAPVTAAALMGTAAALYSAGAFSGGGAIDENPILFWIITVTVSVSVFWATRWRAGIIILFLTAAYMSAAFDFLLYPVSLGGYLAASFGMAILYQCTAQRSGVSAYGGRGNGASSGVGNGDGASAGVGNGGRMAVRTAAFALIAVLMASGLYYGVVKPLDPPKKDMRLAQKLMSMQIMKEAGISSKKVLIADPPEEPEVPPEQPEQPRKEGGGKAGDNGSLAGAMAITYKRYESQLWIAAAAPVLIFFLAFSLKLLLRRRWYANQLRKTNEAGAAALYLYFVRKLKKAGLKRPESLTLLEYAAASQERLERFSVYDADFLRLTQTYLKMIYGYQQISDEERELFHDFYKEFYKNLRAEMGTLRYCVHFFTI